MKTDKQRILKFAKRMGFHVDCFVDPQYICDDARTAGAVESITFGYGKGTHSKAKNYVSLNFELNKKGKLIGLSTDARNSFEKRK